MQNQTISISLEEYTQLKKKAKFADDAMMRLKLSLDDIKNNRIKRIA